MTQRPVYSSSVQDSASVNRIALRLPIFWRGNVPFWIRQCDGAFVLSHITQDETKYAELVSTLDAETLSHVSDIILSPTATDKYALSDRLICEFTDSEYQKIKKLLTELQLGDDKPSHLLQKMKELSGGQLQDEFLKNLWLQRLLPSQVQTVLSVSSEQLDKLAEIADKFADIALPVAVYDASEASVTPAPNTIQELSKQIAELQLQVAYLSRSHNRPYFRRR